MVKVRVVAPLLALAMLTVAVPAGAQEPFEQCGDIQLVFRNPDLQRRNDGMVHASGQFFAQFQAIGANADKIEVFGFSFGPAPSPIEDDSGVCDLPPQAWFTGAYVLNYRADTNPDDGFFINLQTALVPDGQYTAAVHAYDAQNNELARAWVNAVVDNCDASGPAPSAPCGSDAAQLLRHDKTAPWPIILPGDGDIDAAPDRPSGATLTVEFAEKLSEFRFFLNGNDETQNMTEWPGRLWDNDYIPGYGPSGLGAILVPECSQQPPQSCTRLGVSYYYDKRPITPDDVVRVEAIDLAGNLAKKEIHIGSGAGGAITDDLPNLQITVDSLSKTINAGETAIFQYQLTNAGGSTAHPFARVEQETKDRLPGWEFTWTPAHQPTDPGATKIQELGIRPPPNVQVGTYRVNATIEYEKGNVPQKQTWNLRINIGNAPGGGGPATEGPDSTGGGKGKESPGLGPVLALGLLGAAMVARRRW